MQKLVIYIWKQFLDVYMGSNYTWATMKRIWATAIILGLSWAPTASNAGDATPEELLASVYEAHQPWVNKEINFADKGELSKYFDPELTKLFLREEKCKADTGELCNLDFDPILCAQDYEDPIRELSFKGISLDPVIYEVSFINFGKQNLIYVLRKTSLGWRVSDIRCPVGGVSLKKSLAQPLPQ